MSSPREATATPIPAEFPPVVYLPVAETVTDAIYRDFDASRVAAFSADEAAAAAAKTEATVGRVGLKVGGVLALAGVVYDIVATDKPVGQAIVSGAAGFSASILAGAAIGTAIPIPVVGTALGAVGGALAGLLTSGAVDAIYQNGIGTVGDAIEAGADAVANAAKAVGGALGNAWDAIF
ncbi:hypothetical protein DMH04_44310 [Kibdelosporangium aridum]|uniref:Uncharacterized protein n=1 Tax=Kibdelosporangium aridum TaxID=2030 RepID=A0A428YQ03_KIBAR|nr:hypothetical protein [Kibdelosporangium aridum]RSM70640.1 hypothetical protein DMH04_44310 [Kibdelosporangium aridum]